MDEDDILRIRKAAGVVGCTQEHFAETLGISTRTYRNWEQGVRKPNGAALQLLRMMDAAPDETIALLKRSRVKITSRKAIMPLPRTIYGRASR